MTNPEDNTMRDFVHRVFHQQVEQHREDLARRRKQAGTDQPPQPPPSSESAMRSIVRRIFN